MKKKRVVVIASCLLVALVGTVAFASSNISDIEQKWLDFQKALTNKMVEDGKLTQEVADEKISALQEKLEQSEEDIIYEKFSKNGMPSWKDKRKASMIKGFASRAVIESYAEITGEDIETILQTCRENECSIWKLAEKNGVLEELKEKMLAQFTEKLDNAIEKGKLTQEKADAILEKYTQFMEDPKARPPMKKHIDSIKSRIKNRMSNRPGKGGMEREDMMGPVQ